MDYREKIFRKRFENAQKILKTKSFQDIISIKIREHCVNSSEYREYIKYIEHDLMLEVRPVNEEFGEHDEWLVTDRQGNSVLLFEHETGLEILYTAGAIASLIALLPILSNGWKFFRNKFHDRFHHSQDVEVRKFNQNIFIEESTVNIENYILEENKKLLSKIDKLEKENKKLKQKIKKK